MAEWDHHQRPSSWSDSAGDYETMFAPFSGAAAAAALARLELQPGERFLDVAAGTGAVTLRAAALGARVTAIDFSAGMLQLLRDKLDRHGTTGIEALVMDGQQLTFPDGSFDAAGSNVGLIFFPDLAQGLRELHRVLRPGGRAFITSLASAEGASPVAALIGRSIAEVAPDFRPRDAPSTVLLTTPEAMVDALTNAGFAEVRSDTVAVPFPIDDPDAFWQRWVRHAPPTALRMAQLPDELHDAARRRFAELFADAPDRDFATQVLIGTGRRV